MQGSMKFWQNVERFEMERWEKELEERERGREAVEQMELRKNRQKNLTWFNNSKESSPRTAFLVVPVPLITSQTPLLKNCLGSWQRQ